MYASACNRFQSLLFSATSNPATLNSPLSVFSIPALWVPGLYMVQRFGCRFAAAVDMSKKPGTQSEELEVPRRSRGAGDAGDEAVGKVM